MEIKIDQLSKTFGDIPVLKKATYSLQSGSIYCLMGPSGSGKTTFFRILMGFEQADEGSITGLENKKLSVVFQEDRLCESFNPIDNVAMILPDSFKQHRTMAYEELSRLLPKESLSLPVSAFSGGMKRRVAIVRALIADSDMILMDEPFTGLDEVTKKAVIQYIKEKTRGKLVIISTHQEEDISLLNGTLITL